MSNIVSAKALRLYLVTVLTFACAYAQDASAPKQPLDHILGAISAVDPAAHTVTVKEDKSGASQTILLAGTKTLLKVEPGAKDLKSAVRITAEDLQIGDRVDVRGLKTDAPDTLAARSVVLMSARDLQSAHQQQAAAWQNSTAGAVASTDASAGTITINVHTPEGPKPVTVATSKTTEFTRYSPANPGVPASSQFAEIQASDHVRVIGDKSEDGATIKAQRVYSGAFRTFPATISAIGADAKSLTVTDLATKKSIQISLNDDSAIRKLPPPMALMLARRLNPDYKAAAGNGSAGATAGGPVRGGATPSVGPAPDGAPASGAGGHGGFGGGGAGMRSGDMSQMLERIPKIGLSDLKAGDAVVVSGVSLGAGDAHLLATALVAGVEPILQSAPKRQGQNVGGDWGFGEIAAPQ